MASVIDQFGAKTNFEQAVMFNYNPIFKSLLKCYTENGVDTECVHWKNEALVKVAYILTRYAFSPSL